MRTTLTLDDDVAAELERVRKAREISLKELVNDLLRAGLAQSRTARARRRPFSTRSVDLGDCLLGNLDDVASALAASEGDRFR